jgi:hypothetical protein
MPLTRCFTCHQVLKYDTEEDSLAWLEAASAPTILELEEHVSSLRSKATTRQERRTVTQYEAVIRAKKDNPDVVFTGAEAGYWLGLVQNFEQRDDSSSE